MKRIMFGRKKTVYKTKWFFVSTLDPIGTLEKLNKFIEEKKAHTHSYSAVKRDDGTLFPVSWDEDVKE